MNEIDLLPEWMQPLARQFGTLEELFLFLQGKLNQVNETIDLLESFRDLEDDPENHYDQVLSRLQDKKDDFEEDIAAVCMIILDGPPEEREGHNWKTEGF